MTPVDIRPCTVAEIAAAPNIDALLAEYGEESGMAEIGEQSAQFPVYEQLERAGMLHAIGAFREDELVGFITVLVSALPHYGRHVATSESLFVTAGARKTGAGLRLLTTAQATARALGAEAFLLSAPEGSQLAEVMQGLRDWRPSNRVFVKEL